MDVAADFKSFQDQVTASLVNATRTAARISNEDLNFHRSSSTKLSNALDAQNSRVLRLTNKLLKAATKDSSISAPKLQNQDGIEDNWRGIVDVIDDLLEKADASLDEFSGVLRRLSPSLQDGTETPPRQTERQKKIPMIYSNTNLRKPQLDFRKPVNNYDKTPFKPLLRTKPHALVPLGEALQPGEDGRYQHPYASEIKEFQYPKTVYTNSTPISFTPPTDSEAVFVDTEEGVRAILAELKLAKEIAIDLEHHDTHSFIGLVSLMQISTREKDWIVDTLKPWRENLQILNEVFTDPNILKVFHGSSMDMIWLQRDLGLYVVGLFDTYHAAVALDFPKKGLSYLLERFANFQAQKKYQLADWRIRPLPHELLDYARSDTHYLLFIYDNLRNMLLDASTPSENLIHWVLEGSKKEALQTYERPIYDAENGLGPVGWFKPLMQRSVRFDNVQFAVYRALHEWRDQKARALDEGEQHILTLPVLWTLAEQMPLSVLDVHKVLRSVPRFVSENAREMIGVIKKAKFEGLNGPSLRDVMRVNEEKFGNLTLWNKKPQRSPHEAYRGIGQTMQMLVANGEIGQLKIAPDVSEQGLSATRSNSSQLWGTILPQIASDIGASVTVATAALRSVLPLTAVGPTSFSSAGQVPIPHSNAQPIVPAIPLMGTDVTPISSVATLSSNQMGEAFVIRDLARSKKRKAEDESELYAPDLPTLPIESGQYSDAATANGNPSQPLDAILQERLRKQAKLQKKAEKRAKNAVAIAEAETARARMQAAEPFDYANADSILHAKADGGIGSGRGAGIVKPMNPYAKALDTSTGAKRLKQGKEQAGKSMTFKS